MDKFRSKIEELTAKQVICLIAAVGLLVFFSGLNNPFQGDDSYQIVNNTPVHSLANLPELFQHSTFYNGDHLVGIYYRPPMSATFSVVYALFGANPSPYHLVQLGLYIGSAVILYLVFKHFFKKTIVALPLALIFLVHPLNSQVVYSIPTMQDALFFFFGILALWLLIRYQSSRSLCAAAFCLFLAMLSKESGMIFTAIAGLYLFWFDRSRLKLFMGVILLPVILYIALKINAVGIFGTQHTAPIDEVSLGTRLLTAPSILLFYAAKFIFPLQLATGYYWVHSTFSLGTFLLPLLADALIVGLFIYFGYRVHKRLSKLLFSTYLFFAAWTTLGVLPYLGLLRLDMTVCETWFYFAMAGLLALIGLGLQTFRWQKLTKQVGLAAALVVVFIFGIRTGIRGADYQSQYILAQHDVAVSTENYSALGNISQELIHQQKYTEAATYAKRSIAIYPVVSNYTNLGVALQQSGDYVHAAEAYRSALKHGDLAIIYENLGLIYVVYAQPDVAKQFLQQALTRYPHDFKLWVYLAVFEGAKGSPGEAKSAIITATRYGSVPAVIYNAIATEQPLTLPLLGETITVR